MHAEKSVQINDNVCAFVDNNNVHMARLYMMRYFEMCENWVSRFNKYTLSAGPLARRI